LWYQIIGIGLGLVKSYVANPNITVIAGVRDIANSNSLKGIKLGAGSNIIIVKLDSASRTDAKAAVEEIKSRHGITSLYIVIANAGIGKYWGTVLESPPEEFLDHYNINVIGLVILFQATWPVLDTVAAPKFVVITSAIGSISAMKQIPLPDSAYGVSKTAANFVTRKLHFEHEKLLVVLIHPGYVDEAILKMGIC
jgi:norsolorinic acid ketoreductase